MSDASTIIEQVKDAVAGQSTIEVIEELTRQPDFEILRDEYFRALKNHRYITKEEFNRNVSIIKCYRYLGDYPTTTKHLVELFVQNFPDGTEDDLIVMAAEIGLFKPFAVKAAWFAHWNNQVAQVPASMRKFFEDIRSNAELTEKWIRSAQLYDVYKRRTKKPHITFTAFGRMMKGSWAYRGKELVSTSGYNALYNLNWRNKGTHGTFYFIHQNSSVR